MDEIRLMVPALPRDLPQWELKRDGQVIGWVREWRSPASSRPLYKAIGVDPENGNHVDLDNSGDREERIRAVYQFHEHPEQSVHRRSGIIRG